MQINDYLNQIKLPTPNSHKGQNGKLLIIGGSELFHAASKWSLDVASKFVDMVFYSSVPENNELIKEAKGNFWNGIVISRKNIEDYIREADAILIGPGMQRSDDTEFVVNYLLTKYPDKKWVIDAGALQMVDPKLLTSTCILTPHRKEFVTLLKKIQMPNDKCQFNDIKLLKNFKLSGNWDFEIKHLLSFGSTILLKGLQDVVFNSEDLVEVTGGNPGMTKGGTGDVLAGLVAALYCKHDAMTATVVGSYINKKAGDQLYEQVGPFFNASDLCQKVPEVLWQELQQNMRE